MYSSINIFGGFALWALLDFDTDANFLLQNSQQYSIYPRNTFWTYL